MVTQLLHNHFLLILDRWNISENGVKKLMGCAGVFELLEAPFSK